MGDNAQTSVPKFTSGDVLTAANTNLLANGIPVFSGTATRDAAFGGSGEKDLAEGQFAYLEDSNTVQYYDSAAWQPVGATPGLVYITGASFTGVASVSAAANTFSATYTNYRLVVKVSSADTNREMWLRPRAASTDETGGNYYYANTQSTTGAAASSTGGTAATKFALGLGTNAVAGNELAFIVDIIQPQAAANTFFTGTGIGLNTTYTVLVGGALNCYLVTSTQYDSITILPSAGTFTGTYKVYGYSNS